MAYHFRNLVFEGGGVKGIAYLGAMQVLEKKGILAEIKRVGGTSVGAINAVLLALGYSYSEQKKILWEMSFTQFLDASWLVPNIMRVFNRFGWYKGDSFQEWILKLIKDKMGTTAVTFQDLKNKKRDLYVYGANLSTHFSEVFSVEHTPKMRIAEAVRISMSLPVFFRAVRNQRKDVYVDGGLLNNYPVKLFDREKYLDPVNLSANAVKTSYYNEQNKAFLQQKPGRSPYIYNRETLGFRLDSEQEIALFRHDEPQAEKIDHFHQYVFAMVKTVLESQNDTHLHSDDWQRTVYVDTLGVSTTEFDLPPEKKQQLEDSGRKGTEAYFAWYDDPANQPVNRP